MADVSQQATLELAGTLGFRMRGNRIAVKVGIAHGDTQQIAQDLQADQVKVAVLRRVAALQIQQPQHLLSEADRQNDTRTAGGHRGSGGNR